MQQTIIVRSSLAQSSRQFIARQTGLDLTSFGLTRDGAWITLARRITGNVTATPDQRRLQGNEMAEQAPKTSI